MHENEHVEHGATCHADRVLRVDGAGCNVVGATGPRKKTLESLVHRRLVTRHVEVRFRQRMAAEK